MSPNKLVPQDFTPLTIGIVGFGNFGQFLSKAFAAQGHRVVGQSRGDYYEVAAAIGCEYVQSADKLMDCEPHIVVFCTSIMSLDTVLSRFPLKRLANKLVADVLSVKLYPHDLLLKCLPSSTDIVCTHPMFGPESGEHSWKGLPFVYDVVRIDPLRKQICDAFIDIWRSEGCTMVQMECAQHDKIAASTQFITHTTGRMLAQLNLQTTPINTKGYESLLAVVDTTCKDSFDLYYGLFKYNPNARQELDKLENALGDIRNMLERTERNEAQTRNLSRSKGVEKPCISEEILRTLRLRVSPRI
ncbi:Arogenate dehydrogenase 1, chloroplastic [Gracilariopsis chorda]|uniref:Arogenate dehydrogenase 1, chloroplastic n=1 Tax=Gracilariopsis chorda TaxID=448386 RepID=A0A2V3J0D3_9FLOR|nr:Arogenate dehydrogenase 1, chloroplastic [Gracilariopsis chorda]|eukprot:PXF46820.1 Arogenate dehydrogenase 1, chloroplastic [Gracilariopsis chorda]